jgi:hypothetical protein
MQQPMQDAAAGAAKLQMGCWCVDVMYAAANLAHSGVAVVELLIMIVVAACAQCHVATAQYAN